MRRTILPLVAGTAVGAAATYALLRGGSPELPPMEPATSEATGELPRVPDVRGNITRSERPLPAAQRGALYQLAAAADERTLRRLLDDAAGLTPSPAKRFALQALLIRYAELDAPEAVRRARQLRVDTASLASLFQVWAAGDAEAALEALGRVEDRRAAHDVALALVEVLGGADAGAARLADALPRADAAEFLADLLARRAAAAPAEALQHALTLGDALTVQSALQRVGEAWARTDPRAALAQSASIQDPRQRAAFEDGVLREWARKDTGAALEHLLSSGTVSVPMMAGFGPSPASSRGSALAQIAQRDPVRVLEAAARLPPPLNQIMPQIALQALAEEDPMRAIRYAEAATGAQRRNYLLTAAGAFGRRDPDGALDWVRGAAPNGGDLLGAVVRGIAQTDPERALALALESSDRMMRIQIVQTAVAALAAGGGDMESVANRLLADARGAANGLAGIVMSAWAFRDPKAAVDWLLANGDRAGAGSYAPRGSAAGDAGTRAGCELFAARAGRGPPAMGSGRRGRLCAERPRSGTAVARADSRAAGLRIRGRRRRAAHYAIRSDSRRKAI